MLPGESLCGEGWDELLKVEEVGTRALTARFVVITILDSFVLTSREILEYLHTIKYLNFSTHFNHLNDDLL